MSSLFFQSQLYVAELCEPVTLTDFLEEPSYPKSPLESLSNSMLPSSDQKPRKVTPTEKINPYNSHWASLVLNKHYKVEVTCKGNKWIIKKKNDDEPSKSMVSCLPNLPKPIQNQTKLFSNTASKETKKRLNKFIIEQRKQQNTPPPFETHMQANSNSSLPHLYTNVQPPIKGRLYSDSPKQMPIFDVNFLKNLNQFIL